MLNGSEVTILVYLGIKEGKLAEFKELATEMCEAVKSEVDTIAYGFYVSEDNSTFTVREVYKNAAAMFAHAGNVGPLLMKLGPLTEWKGADIHGPKAEIESLKSIPMFATARFWAQEVVLAKI